LKYGFARLAVKLEPGVPDPADAVVGVVVEAALELLLLPLLHKLPRAGWIADINREDSGSSCGVGEFWYIEGWVPLWAEFEGDGCLVELFTIEDDVDETDELDDDTLLLVVVLRFE
jgi:hypothetical protein